MSGKPDPEPLSRLAQAALVSAGGALGAMSRFSILLQFPTARTGFPAGTLVVNGLGALGLGLLLGWLDSRRGTASPRWIRSFGLAGFLGAFTTLSLVVVDHAILITSGRTWEALVFTSITIVGTIGIALIGVALGTRFGGGEAELSQ
jgi:CrcB protein